ncbi:MAG: glycine--tRNA ligase subunit beta [Proteobacteria bacterium]|nr:glycine--tRNA ligase subunit beta [Pseudomonadota bacterium]MBU2227288.1 glycine--tRNA ligase subunit beta [Pseudomonadota bacterium]
MGKELLLEIGTEEIPAAFLPKALTDMAEITRKELAANRIRHGEVRTMGTPRRLFLCVDGVAERQEDQVIEKLGPARSVAFDDQGNPSRAVLGFAKGQGIAVAELETATTDKGEYVCARKKITGEATAGLLPFLLPRVIAGIAFRKSMRWSDLEFRFARPIHWLLALFDGRIVPFRIAEIETGNASRGHRFMSPASFPVANGKEYLVKTREHFVIVDPAQRKRIIAEEAKKAAQSVGGSILPHEELLETVTFLTEYPTIVCGSFDPEYLKLPREVLITTMISHQKYFPVLDNNGALLPFFIAVSNTVARDPAVVRRGNERVIRARLADARFFFEEDRKIPLEDRIEGLRKVTFHTLLGTSYEKVLRFRKLAAVIVARIDPALAPLVERAATLAKADLDTQMVGEFAELQGIMGREYALLAGEDPHVAKAVYEHCLPTAAGGGLPETDVGAIVSIADKLDSITGFFGVGLAPTGTADPYALRRQALGVINIILNKRYLLPLGALIDESIAILGPLLKRPAGEVKADVLEFFRGRFENQLLSQGHPYDVVAAVVAAGAEDLVRAEEKVLAMIAFKTHPDFQPLAIAFKRVVNIIRGFENGAVDPSLFASPQETELHEAFVQIRQTVLAKISGGDYLAALVEMARLRKPVDAFFEAVLVMAEEERLRFNRLSLLKEIADLFHGIADFSRIVTEG